MRYGAWLPVTNEASHTFVPAIMDKRPVVLDLGANLGDFHDSFRRRFVPKRYIAVEPTPTLAAKLISRGLNVIEVAVAPVTGPVSFSVDVNSEASSILTGGAADVVDGMSYSDLLTQQHLNQIDLVKMDIEGAELFALADSERHIIRAAKQITVEFHDFCGVLTTAQVVSLVARMHENGFYGVRFSNNNTDWLFVRDDAISNFRWATVLAMASLRRAVHRLRM